MGVCRGLAECVLGHLISLKLCSIYLSFSSIQQALTGSKLHKNTTDQKLSWLQVPHFFTLNYWFKGIKAEHVFQAK